MRKKIAGIKKAVSSKKKQQLKNKIGKPPGTIIFVGESKLDRTHITVTEYNEHDFSVNKIDSVDRLKYYKERKNEHVIWIDINGLNDVDLLTKVGEIFSIHTLILEDVVNMNHQPKVEYYEDDIFVVLKRISWENGQEPEYNQVSLLLMSNLIITFSDNPKEDYNQIHQRIESGKNVFRKTKEDYLFYVLIDYIVDGYFLINEELSERIDLMQEELLTDPSHDDLSRIQTLEKETHKIKNSVRPVREIIASIGRQESDFINETTLIYFRDTMDHVVQISDTLETQRDSISTLINIHLSSISNRMNEVMKVLTLIATIFIPLTFIAGVYGMNFSYMPELQWKYGYFVVIGLMLVVGIVLGIYFKKKKWL